MDNKKNTFGEILIYQAEDGLTKVDVTIDQDTVWLSKAQMAVLFQRDRSVISKHIKNVFEEGELVEKGNVQKMRIANSDKPVEFFSLDVIISVGYRVKSQRGVQFRIWATERLKEYMIKGFTMDDERLKGNAGGNYWKELLDRIRDIRSSEKVLYRQVLDLYATSVDYDPKSTESIRFFKIVQNKLHYAAHGHTAAELIYDRADAEQPFIKASSNVTIEGASVEASATDCGIFAVDGNVTISGGTVNATGRSVGIYADDSVTINGGTVNATGEGGYIEPQSVSAAARIVSGISARTIEIKSSINSLTATGKDMAIYGSVKNEIAGTGWTNTAGTDGKADIAINTEGQTLDYKKVQFPKVAPAPAPSTATPVLAAKGIASGKKAVKISWNGVSGAAKYEVYLNRCNTKSKKYTVKLKGATAGNSMKVKKLRKGRCYKFYVVAKDANGNVIAKSLTGHFIAGNVKGKKTNAKSLTLGASSASLTKGATFKITAKQKKVKKGKKLLNSGHAPLLRYVSDNPAVATVDAKGLVTGTGAGSCNVYVFTVNGISKSMAVTVK